MSGVKKQKKYLQSYKISYSNEYPFLKKSNKSDHHAFCTECGVDFSVAHAGKGDIINHVRSKKHNENSRSKAQTSKIHDFFENNSDSKVIRAECLVTAFLVEHNLPLSCADHVGPLLRKIFPNNDV